MEQEKLIHDTGRPTEAQNDSEGMLGMTRDRQREDHDKFLCLERLRQPFAVEGVMVAVRFAPGRREDGSAEQELSAIGKILLASCGGD